MPNAIKAPYLSSGNVGMPPLEVWPEAASQDFGPGALITLVADTGVLKVTKVGNNTTTLIYGMAMHDASGTEDADVNVQPLPPSVQFVMCVATPTADAAASTTTYAYMCEAELHCHGSVDPYHQYIDSTNIGDQATSANASVVIIKDAPLDNSSESYGLYVCKVADAFWQGTVGIGSAQS